MQQKRTLQYFTFHIGVVMLVSISDFSGWTWHFGLEADVQKPSYVDPGKLQEQATAHLPLPGSYL